MPFHKSKTNEQPMWLRWILCSCCRDPLDHVWHPYQKFLGRQKNSKQSPLEHFQTKMPANCVCISILYNSIECCEGKLGLFVCYRTTLKVKLECYSCLYRKCQVFSPIQTLSVYLNHYLLAIRWSDSDHVKTLQNLKRHYP